MDREYLELLYEPCQSQEELKQHIKTFLKIDLPDFTVDEESNSNPMDFVWGVYHVFLTGKGPNRWVAACSRNSMKTLCASIIRFYAMIHFRRSGTHLAATLDQSSSAVMYLDKFLGIDGVREYISTSNTKTKELKNLPTNSFTENKDCILRIAVATLKGVNSQRGSYNSRDEIDLLPRKIIGESAFIADPTNDKYRFSPVEVNLSSRKTDDGPMQDMIDEAESVDAPDDLRLVKWSMVDFMEKCPDEISESEKGKIRSFIHKETLDVIWDPEQFDSMPESLRTQYKEVSAFHGCRTCPAFIACQARSPSQKGTSKALRNIDFVKTILRGVKDSDSIIAQALNWRPGKSGNVFRTFSKFKHTKNYIDSYEWIFGEKYNPENLDADDYNRTLEVAAWKITPSKEFIIQKMKEQNWYFVGGVDFGYSPARAVGVIWAYHKKQKRAVMIHVESSQHMDNKSWSHYLADGPFKKYGVDLVAPDLADPASPTYFGSKRLPSLDSKPSKIATGVSQIRGLLFDPIEQKEKLIIINDESEDCARLIESFQKWTHLKTPLGFDVSKFEDNDYCDFCFTPGQTVITKKGAKSIEDVTLDDEVLTHKGRFKRVKAVMQRDYSGEVITLKPYGREPVTCTPEHKIFSLKYKRSNRIEDGKKLTGQLRPFGEAGFIEANQISKTQKNKSHKDSLLFSVIQEDDNTELLDMKDFLPKWEESDNLMISPRKNSKCEKVVRLDKYLSFIHGHFAAEGSCGQSKKSGKKLNLKRKTCVVVALHENEILVKKIYEKVGQMFFLGSIHEYRTKNNKGVRLTLNSMPLWTIFKPFGANVEKKYPNYVTNLSNENSWYVILGHAFGDGHFGKEGLRIPTISRHLAYQLVYLMSKVGLKPKIRLRNCKGRWMGFGKLYQNNQYLVQLDINDSYRLLDKASEDELIREVFKAKKINLNNRAKMPSNKIKTGANFTAHLISGVCHSEYTGKVYTLSVEDDESYTINGISVKNCDPSRYALAPFIEESNITISVAQSPTEREIKQKAIDGDEATLRELARQQQIKNQFAEKLQQEHGITQNPFTPPQNNAKKDKATKGPVKFKF